MKKTNKKFLLLWTAQYISLLGSNMSGFVLGLYFFKQTQSVALYSLFPFFTVMPQILFAPVLGVFVDKLSRKTSMVIGHSGAGICSLIIMLMFYNGFFNAIITLGILACGSVFSGFTHPAYTASVTQIVPKEQLSRVSGMQPLGFALILIAAPALAGTLMVQKGIGAVFLIDVITFSIALTLISMIQIPKLKLENDQLNNGFKRYRNDLIQGLLYLKNQPVLLYTLILLFIVNFNTGIIQVLITPLVLGVADSDMVGYIWAVSGVGLLVGSFTLLLFKEVKHRPQKMLILCNLQGIVFLTVYFETSLLVLGIGAFFFMLSSGLIGGINTVLWQKTIPKELQGRIFGLQTLITGGSILLGYLFSGPLIDNLVDPLLEKKSGIIQILSEMMGQTATPGISTLLFILGFLTVGIVGFLFLYMHFRYKAVVVKS